MYPHVALPRAAVGSQTGRKTELASPFIFEADVIIWYVIKVIRTKFLYIRIAVHIDVRAIIGYHKQFLWFGDY